MVDDWKIRTEPVKVYLCDGKKPCISSPFCKIGNPEDGMCMHTKDIYHGKNYRRENYEMQFETVATGDLWEVEDGETGNN